MKKHNKKNHLDILDVSRGFAILLMFVYHFIFDLDYYGYIQQNFSQDEFWLNFRIIIVTLFLLIMGVSLYLSCYRGLSTKRFKQRLYLLVFYASLVSISSWIMYPKAMIFFGILHFIILASVLGLLFIRLGKANFVIGLLLIIISQFFSHTFFDQAYMQWFGLMTKLPVTVDYVPFLPWFGVVLIGMYLGQILSQQPSKSYLKNWQATNQISKTLALGGRYSLHIYMLHQPLFLGILYIISQIIR